MVGGGDQCTSPWATWKKCRIKMHYIKTDRNEDSFLLKTLMCQEVAWVAWNLKTAQSGCKLSNKKGMLSSAILCTFLNLLEMSTTYFWVLYKTGMHVNCKLVQYGPKQALHCSYKCTERASQQKGHKWRKLTEHYWKTIQKGYRASLQSMSPPSPQHWENELSFKYFQSMICNPLGDTTKE